MGTEEVFFSIHNVCYLCLLANGAAGTRATLVRPAVARLLRKLSRAGGAAGIDGQAERPNERERMSQSFRSYLL